MPTKEVLEDRWKLIDKLLNDPYVLGSSVKDVVNAWKKIDEEENKKEESK